MSAPDATQHSGSVANTHPEQPAAEVAQSSEASSVGSASIQHPASITKVSAESPLETAATDDADTAPAVDDSTSSSKSILAPTDARAVQSINTSLHPTPSELTQRLEAQLHPELARVASDMIGAQTVTAAPALAQAAAEFGREAESAELPRLLMPLAWGT